MTEDLISFYLQGRAVKSISRIRKFAADPDEIAVKITAGAGVRPAIGAACDEAASQLRANRKARQTWAADSKDDLVGLGAGGEDLAWGAYCQGMSDELAYVIESEVLDALEGDEEEGEGDDDVEESDDDDDESDDDKADAK